MNRKSILLALMLLLLSATGAAARQPARPAARPTFGPTIAATPSAYAQGGCFVAGMNGSNETATAGNQTQVVATLATGIGAFVLSPTDPTTTTRKLTYYIAFTTNILGNETAAHIHRGAPGVAGPPIIPLPVGNPISGTVDLTSTADLEAGLLYVNIHTTANPNGEIRGQILPGGGCFSANISGASETPRNFSPAKGSGTFLLVPPDPLTTTRKLVYDIEYSGLLAPESGAHIHKGAPGVSGDIVEPLPPGNPKRGTLDIEAQTASDLLAGLLYVNIHSLVVVAGEIRGQILPFGGGCYTATLSGSTETPANNSAVTGRGTFFLSPATVTSTLKLAYTITFSPSLTATAAHIHKAAPGVPGGIVIPLSISNPISGTSTLTETQAADLIAGLYYVNIHSANFTQGEIRGQIVQTKCRTLFLPVAAK